MYKLKKFGKVFTSKFVGTGLSSYEKRIYRFAVSQKLRNTAPEHPILQRPQLSDTHSIPSVQFWYQNHRPQCSRTAVCVTVGGLFLVCYLLQDFSPLFNSLPHYICIRYGLGV